jgi:hypothetical protein
MNAETLDADEVEDMVSLRSKKTGVQPLRSGIIGDREGILDANP